MSRRFVTTSLDSVLLITPSVSDACSRGVYFRERCGTVSTHVHVFPKSLDDLHGKVFAI